MPTTLPPVPREPQKSGQAAPPPEVFAAKEGGKPDDDFGDFNEEDFDDDFDDDFEEEMDDEYELAEIEGEVEVQEIDDEDLAGLPIDKIDPEADDDDAEPAAAPAEDDEEFEDAE